MIRRLIEAPDATLVQETTFSIDVQGRYVCNTWDEVIATIGSGGLACCMGGRALYWGGWAPRLTAVDLARRPAELAQYLNGTYNDVEREIGVDPTTDYISGPLFDELLKAFKAAAKQVPSVDRIDEAPLAIQGAPPAPGLFSFDKYSSAPILITAVREDIGDASSRGAASLDAGRQLLLVPR